MGKINTSIRRREVQIVARALAAVDTAAAPLSLSDPVRIALLVEVARRVGEAVSLGAVVPDAEAAELCMEVDDG